MTSTNIGHDIQQMWQQRSSTQQTNMEWRSERKDELGRSNQFAKYAGAGTAVPITGFANSVVSPAVEFSAEGKILGTGAKMFNLAGPVIVYGCSAASLYGLVYYLFLK